MCCPLVFEFSVGIGDFVIGLGQISFFFSCETLIVQILIVLKYYVQNVLCSEMYFILTKFLHMQQLRNDSII